jgi:hypothetical protein
MAKLRVFFCAVAASLVWVGAWPLSTAAASTDAHVTVSPLSVTLTDQYAQVTHKLIGTGAVVTVKVGPNHVLKPYWPVEVQECDPYPSSLSDCDMLTTLAYDQLTKLRVDAAGNGSVTIHFVVWAPLPQLWDPASVINVGPGHPVALWIGDDPSNWATTGVVSAPILINVIAGKRGTHRSVEGAVAAPISGSTVRTSHGTRVGAVIRISVLLFAVLAGAAVVVDRRRRRTVTRRQRAATS